MLRSLGPSLDRLDATFAKTQDQLDEERIRQLFRDNQFEEGYAHVKRLFAERTTALHETSILRTKVI